MLATLALVLTVSATAQDRPDGRWEGAIQVMGGALTISVEFKAAPEGWQANIDIPQQGARGLALTGIRIEPPQIHFELPAGPGLAVFDGELKDGVIRGSFSASWKPWGGGNVESDIEEEQQAWKPPDVNPGRYPTRPGKGWPPAGSESCAWRGNPQREA